ncbi:FecR family protein [Snuella sedimenti]|uniref:FecR domain-containing protein n=1 Tax=Snuella sedimenti TaxID=2798802 RepID=A0A8J7IIA1_9FLAO|nr:FecR family protein [Snuella sedimenti]MBJ6369393.1 FecR domain-containing protein [Snuella sedimenti]
MIQNIEKLIVKYLTNSATATELDVLSKWVEDPKNKMLFKEFVETHVAINYNMNDPETKKVIEQFLKDIKKEESSRYRIVNQPIYKYAVAASILLLVSLTIFLNRNESKPNKVDPTVVNTPIEPGTDKATLTLEDGTVVALEKGNSFQTQNANSNGEEIIYKDGKGKVKELVYNYLTIPRGGQFHIVLSDGTEVWLNSESQLKYPIDFIEGNKREVELVYGEAYFDVSPSALHKGAKFKVINQSQEVEVLGTEFNIKAYKDESNIYTTLVEGSVVVDNGNLKHNLTPNQQYILNPNTNNFSVAEVDVKTVTSWKDGVFSFIDVPLKDIMKVVSRWYDVDVVFENKTLESIEFIGVLDKKISIDEILSIIKSTSINDYNINKKTITLR